MREHKWYDIHGNKAFLVCGITYLSYILYALVTGDIHGFPIVEIILGGGLICFLISPIVAELVMIIFKMPNDVIEYILCTVCLAVVLGIIYGIVQLFLFLASFIPKI